MITVNLNVVDPQMLRRAARTAARERGVSSKDWDMMRIDDPIRRDLGLLLDLPGVEVEEFDID